MNSRDLQLPSGYSKRFIAFIDILGFSDAIAKSQRDPEEFKKVHDVLVMARTLSEPGKHGKGDVRANAFSDSIILSAADSLAGVEELVQACELTSVGILAAGLLCRGAIHWGDLCHDENYVFGPSLVKAYRMESTQAVYPRIIATREFLGKLTELAKQHELSDWLGDVFRRDGDGCVYLSVLGWILDTQDDEKDKPSSSGVKIAKRLREFLEGCAREYVDNPNLFSKYQWMISEYNDFVSAYKSTEQSLQHIKQYSLPDELSSITPPDQIPKRRSGKR